MGSLRGGWLFRFSRGGVFGGRRAIILKSHGLDLLQEKEQRDPGEVGAVLPSPGTWLLLFPHTGPYLKASFIQEIHVSTKHHALC